MPVRLVDADLLADRQVHGQVQEGVGAAVLDRVAGRQRGVARRPGRRGTRGARRSSVRRCASIGVQRQAGALLAPRPQKKRRTSCWEGWNIRQLSAFTDALPTRKPMNVTTEQLFTEARTQNGYLPDTRRRRHAARALRPAEVGPDLGQQLPGALRLRAQRARPRPGCWRCVSPGNVQKVREAPVTAIIGMDMAFHDKLPQAVPAHRCAHLVRRQAGQDRTRPRCAIRACRAAT